MSFLDTFFTNFLNFNSVFTLSALSALLVSYIYERFFQVRSSLIIKFNYFCIFLGLLIFVIINFSPEENFDLPIFKSIKTVYVEPISASLNSYQPLYEKSMKSLSPILYKKGLSLLILVLLGLKFLMLIKNLMLTLKLTRSGFLYKKNGNLKVSLSDSFQIPYAFSFLNKSYVSLPLSILSDESLFKTALKHEIQHIRVKDTLVSHFLELMRVLFFLNPFVLKWIENINLRQEFACDESLLNRRGVKSKDYARCLLKVAELETASNNFLVGATGILFSRSSSQLKRRIKRMKNKYKSIKKLTLFVSLILSTSVITVSSYAMHKKNNLTLGYVNKLVKVKDFTKGFPVTVNNDVLHQLNLLVKTRKGRKTYKNGMKNYKQYRGLITKKISNYGHPEELAAVGFVESHFVNVPQRENSRFKAAGVWQFIPSTARNFDLEVSAKTDERLNVKKETDAAMRYFRALHKRFNSWELALISYNAGEMEVQRRIDQTGSRDAWVLIKNGLKIDNNYLAKVQAAAIAMKYEDELF